MGANYFHREMKDLIEGRPIPGDPNGCFRAENVGRGRFDGVELTLGIKLFEGLTLNANYTYLDWDTADGTLPRRPRNSGNVVLNYLQDALNVNLTVNIVGRRDDFRAASPFGTTVTAGYGTVDLASSYRLPWQMPLVKEMSLIGRIQNLFNKKYDQADGFRAPPLNFLLGLRATFGS
jgi:vitamin B12 transporter